MNEFNDLHGDEPTEPLREWNIQPLSDHFKSRNSPPNTRLMVSSIMGRLNHHAIDNGNVEVHPSEFPVVFNSEYVTYTDNTPIKSIDDSEMYHFMESFHSEHDGDLLYVDIQMLQARLVLSHT